MFGLDNGNGTGVQTRDFVAGGVGAALTYGFLVFTDAGNRHVANRLAKRAVKARTAGKEDAITKAFAANDVFVTFKAKAPPAQAPARSEAEAPPEEAAPASQATFRMRSRVGRDLLASTFTSF